MAQVWKSPIDPDVLIIHSTYEDNPYLDDNYVKILQDLISQDENFYRIYTLGEWGLLQRRIYTNYKVIPELPDMAEAKWAYGLDFGLVNPSAVAKIYLLGDRVYAEERLYKSNLTNSDIIEFFSHEQRGDIYGDPTAKQMIVEIQRAGYSAFEGIKGVKESIDLCQRQTIYIPQSSANLIKEIQSYQWKADKDGNVLSEPVKFNDHLMDAMRYGIWGIASRFGFPTARPMPSEPIRSLDFKQGTGNRILDRWLRRDSG